jgi:2Fe-2S ferredoxin
MPKITFLFKDGSRREIDAPENWSIMQIAVDNGVEEIEGACGGSMACATCHVYVHPDWAARVEAQDNEKSGEEEDILDTAFDIREQSRLGCQIKITDALDGLVVALPGTDTGW